MKYVIRTAVLLTAMLPAIAAEAAGDSRQSLSRECEIAVARSAAPAALRESASVYVLDGDRYRPAIENDGPLTCIVERNHPESLIPQCFDRGGIDSVLPAMIFKSEMAVSGASPDEVAEAGAEKTGNGAFKALPGAGVSYMMSAYNYIYVPSAGRVLTVPPHVMFYAPGLDNDDIGGSFERTVTNAGTPVVLNPGPHGYMIVYTEHAANPNEVADACRGELGEAPPRFDPLEG